MQKRSVDVSYASCSRPIARHAVTWWPSTSSLHARRAMVGARWAAGGARQASIGAWRLTRGRRQLARGGRRCASGGRRLARGGRRLASVRRRAFGHKALHTIVEYDGRRAASADWRKSSTCTLTTTPLEPLKCGKYDGLSDRGLAEGWWM
eukprot:356973-Chlamydomonas_euryale.AAC.1